MKRCTKCGEEKPEEDFSRTHKGQPRRHARCKACMRQERYEWAILNPDKIRAYKKGEKPRKRPPKTKAQRRQEYDRRYVEARAATKRWREANPERAKAHVVRWIRENPDAVKEMRTRANHRRRSLARDAYVEDVYPLVVLEMTDGMCGICGEDVDPLDFELDHVIPLACGGEHAYYNVQPAHAACNRKKGAAL